MLLVAVELACDRIVVEETSAWIGCVVEVMGVEVGVGVGVSGVAGGAVPAFGVPPSGTLGPVMLLM